jgi:histidinol phosphatase-like PHP family hydrolase
LPTHSTRSDGVLPPEEVCRRYRAGGYDFLALTDHFIGRFGQRLCASPDPDVLASSPRTPAEGR